MAKAVFLMLAFLGAITAWQVPIAYPPFPAAVVNHTSAISCEFQTNETAALNTYAYIQNANGTNITSGNLTVQPNAKTQITDFNFDSNVSVGDLITIFCDFGTFSAYSETQTVQATNFGSNNQDALVTMGLVSMALFVVIFAYLHTHSANPLWGETWFLIFGLIASFTMLAIMSFAQSEGANGVEVVGLALFVAIFWSFFLSIALFGFNILLTAIETIKLATQQLFGGK